MNNETQSNLTYIDAAQRRTLLVCRIAVPLFCLFITYCAIVPLGNWVVPEHDIMEVLLYGWIDKIYTFDVIQNLLLYLPLGFFAVFSLRVQHWIWGLIYAFCISLFMCCALEYIQSYNPARVPSALDIILNTLSGFIGGAIAAMFYESWIKLFADFGQAINPTSFKRPWPFISLMVILCWGAYQWYPFLPTLHPGYISQGYAPLIEVFNDIQRIDIGKFISYASQALILYVLACVAFKHHPFLFTTGFICLILPMKILLIGRVLSFEAVFGCLCGLSFAIALHLISNQIKTRIQTL